MSTKTVGIIAVVVVAVLLLPLVLGGNKVTMANYNKVEMGMTYAEVKKILGKGKSFEEKMKEEGITMPQGMPQAMPDMSNMTLKMPDGLKLPEGMPQDFQMPNMNDMMEPMLKLMAMEVWIWEKDDDAGISIGFSDGRVAMKSQSGLAEAPSMEMDGMDGFPMPGMPAS